LNISTRP